MTPHPSSKYTNDNPPWKDKEWVYDPSFSTIVYVKLNKEHQDVFLKDKIPFYDL
jgi:hypothetical protein